MNPETGLVGFFFGDADGVSSADDEEPISLIKDQSPQIESGSSPDGAGQQQADSAVASADPDNGSDSATTTDTEQFSPAVKPKCNTAKLEGLRAQLDQAQAELAQHQKDYLEVFERGLLFEQIQDFRESTFVEIMRAAGKIDRLEELIRKEGDCPTPEEPSNAEIEPAPPSPPVQGVAIVGGPGDNQGGGNVGAFEPIEVQPQPKPAEPTRKSDDPVLQAQIEFLDSQTSNGRCDSQRLNILRKIAVLSFAQSLEDLDLGLESRFDTRTDAAHAAIARLEKDCTKEELEKLEPVDPLTVNELKLAAEIEELFIELDSLIPLDGQQSSKASKRAAPSSASVSAEAMRKVAFFQTHPATNRQAARTIKDTIASRRAIAPINGASSISGRGGLFGSASALSVALAPDADGRGASVNVTQNSSQKDWTLYFKTRFDGLDDDRIGANVREEFFTFKLGGGLRVGPQTAVGAEVFYRTGEVTTSSINTRITGDYYGANLQAAHRLAKNVRVSGGIAYIRGDNDLFLQVPDLGIGSFNVDSFSAHATLQGDLPLGPVTLVPTANITFNQINREEFVSQDVLNVPKNNFAAFRANAGVDVKHKLGFDLGSSASLKPRLGVFLDFQDRDTEGALITNGATFDRIGFGAKVNAGVDLELDSGLRVSLIGDYGYYGSDVQRYGALVQLSFKLP